MEIYNLSLGAVFYRDPIDSKYDRHEIFDFDINPLNFRVFVENITATGGADLPEDWAGAFNLAKNLTWRNDSYKFIIHFADANAHGTYWDDNDYYPAEGIKNDEIITYFAKNNFNIAGFRVELSATKSFQRAQQIFRENNNFNYFIKDFDEYSVEKNYFLDLVYESFQNSLYTAVLYGFDISEEQGEINWDEVKGQNNTDFVIIRAGIGNKTDSQFEKNYEGAKKLGIPVGIYWYANSSNSDGAKKEAEICKNIIEGKKFEFPVYYVIEEQFIFNSGHQADIIDNFCNQLTPLNYSCALSSKYDKLTSRFDSVISDYQIWVNYYGDDMPVLDNDWGIWKYNDTGKIKGIEGNVNLDLAIVNYTKATLDNHYNGY